MPDLNVYGPEPRPVQSLTIQSALPGTVLADGSIIPSPGQSVVVKLLSDTTPNGSGSLAQFGSTGAAAGAWSADTSGGAGFIVGVDDAVDPTASPLVDPGAYTQLRILGIPGNQTTGQQRVPVILTSLRDDTIGVTARGVTMNNIFNSWPNQNNRVTGPNNIGGTPWYAGQTLTTPAPGDGGYIYIGGNSLTDYNLTDPRDGSLIDNANISFMTSIQIQGGGIIDNVNASGTPGAPVIGGWLGQKSGYGPEGFFGGGFPGAPVNQLNSAMAMTISNSTLANFQDAAVFTHPDSGNALYRDWTGQTSNATPPPILRSGLKGQAVDLYMYNDTIYNTMVSPLSNQFAVGVQVNAESSADTSGESPMMATIINSTFNQTSHAIRTTSPAFNGTNANSHVNLLAMNDIFANSTNFAVALVGQAGTNASIGTNGFSQIQYSLFFNNVNNNNNDLPTANPADVIWNTNVGDFEGNVAPIFGDPRFIDPAHGNFGLQANSAAIDAARSEIGPLPAGDMIYPTVNQQLDSTGGIRTDPTTLPFGETPGRSDLFGGDINEDDPRKIVTLPGSGSYAFQDEWVPTLSTDPSGITGPATAPGTYSYVPISGQRDSLGFIRIDDAGVPNTGFGKSPFQDIGASEYVNLHPPEVTAVTANLVNQPAPVNFYAVGGKSGANQTPQTINVTFIEPDRSQLDQCHHGAARGAGRQRCRSRAHVHQPRGQAVLHQRDQHAGDQPGRQRAHAPDRRLPDHRAGQRLAGAVQPAGHRP